MTNPIEAAAMGGWQPIATAPKDGTWIVVVGPLKGDNPTFRGMPRACVSRWFTDDDRYDNPAGVPGWCYSAPGYSNLIEPTHWQPLPSPPCAAQAASEPQQAGERGPIDANVQSVINKHRLRAAAGLVKYGVTTERDDLTRREWLTHTQEELMDAAVYLQKLIVLESAAPQADRDIAAGNVKSFDSMDSLIEGLVVASNSGASLSRSPPSER